MAGEDFFVRSEVTAAFAAVLPAGSLDCSDDLIEALTDFVEVEPPLRTPSRELMVRHWVVRQADLDTARAVFDALVATLATDAISSVGPSRSFLVGLAVSLFRTATNLRDKGATLSPLELHLLTVLKANDGASVDQLWSLLKDSALKSQADVEDLLKRLTAVALRDHTVVPLVQQDGAGGWHALT